MGAIVLRIVLWSFGIFIFLQFLLRIFLQLHRMPTPVGLAALLQSPIRLFYRKPKTILAPLQLKPNTTVLEVGPGTGLFTIEAAKQIAPLGKLLCVELQPGFLKKTIEKVRVSTVRNVSFIISDVTYLPLENDSIHEVFLVAVLPLIPHIQLALAEIKRVLKPGGHLLVSEEILEPEFVPSMWEKKWCKEAGFTFVKRIRNIYYYSLIFEK